MNGERRRIKDYDGFELNINPIELTPLACIFMNEVILKDLNLLGEELVRMVQDLRAEQSSTTDDICGHHK